LMLAGEFLFFFIGAVLVVKGYGLDKKVGRLIFPSPPNLIRLFTVLTSMIVVGLAGYQTYVALLEELGDPSRWLSAFPLVLGMAIKQSVNLLAIASTIFVIGMAIYFYFVGDARALWSFVGVVVALWLREIGLSASYILTATPPLSQSLVVNLLIVAVLGIATTAATILVTLKLGKRFENYFKKHGAQENEEG